MRRLKAILVLLNIHIKMPTIATKITHTSWSEVRLYKESVFGVQIVGDNLTMDTQKLILN
jgi:hypothetical protein